MIVCAYNEARYLPACLHSLLAQTRPADEIVVVNNASSDDTGAVARAIPGVRVIDEPVKGLVIARKQRGARPVGTCWLISMPIAGCRFMARAGRATLSRHPALVAVTDRIALRLGPGGGR